MSHPSGFFSGAPKHPEAASGGGGGRARGASGGGGCHASPGQMEKKNPK